MRTTVTRGFGNSVPPPGMALHEVEEGEWEEIPTPLVKPAPSRNTNRNGESPTGP